VRKGIIVSLPESLVKKVDSIRGDLPRCRWIEQAIKQKIKDGGL